MSIRSSPFSCQVEHEFDDLFREMDEVRKAVRRELEGAKGEGAYDAEGRTIFRSSFTNLNLSYFAG